MATLFLLLLLWVLVSVVGIAGFWVVGMIALVRLRTAQGRQPQGQAPSPTPTIREILRDKNHPLSPAARRLMFALKGFGWTWLSGLLAGLTLAVMGHVRPK